MKPRPFDRFLAKREESCKSGMNTAFSWCHEPFTIFTKGLVTPTGHDRTDLGFFRTAEPPETFIDNPRDPLLMIGCLLFGQISWLSRGTPNRIP